MAKFFVRVQRILAGKTNAVLKDLENPEEQLSVFVSELDQEMHALHAAVSGAVADEKRLKIQLDELVARANDWEKRAVLAIEAGNDALAKEALVRRQELLPTVATVQRSWDHQKAATGKLKQSLFDTKRRIDDAKRQYQLKLAHYRTARATNNVTRAVNTPRQGSAMEMMESLDKRIADLEAETETSLELSGMGGGADIEQAFRDLERNQQGADALAELKARLAKGAAEGGAKASG